MLNSVQIVLSPGVEVPTRATTGASGFDLTANIPTSVSLPSLGRLVVPTGVKLAIPEGFEAQVRPRSGLAVKRGITVLNSPGTIDADYRGEVGVILVNLSAEPYTINPGERIAQLVFQPIEVPALVSVEYLEETSRGSGGYGSTGTR